MKKIFTIIILLFTFWSHAQNGITYQAVILNPNTEELPGADNSRLPLVNQRICLEFKILNASSALDYQETINTQTDEFGMVNVIIGTGTRKAGIASQFSAINWDGAAKSLIVSLDPTSNCSNFIEISNQPFTYVPYALYAANGGATGAQGPAGPAGTNGLDGKTILSGTTNPSAGLGTNGDFYINTTTNSLFGPKTNGAWGNGVSLVGPQGIQGTTGPQGIAGVNGTNGSNGSNGLSAYQIWLNAGNTGTEAQFLTALRGATGAQGAQGIQGPIGLTGATGPQGIAGVNGTNGSNGSNGLSAYQIWLNAGNTGTEAQFLTALRGATGAQGLQGIAGVNGTNGSNGSNGLSAYQIWLNAGNTGTEAQFLISLQGAQGPAGPVGSIGPQGIQGPIGLTGAQGPAGTSVSNNTGLGGRLFTMISNTSPLNLRYHQAIKYCIDLVENGFDDWKLATFSEVILYLENNNFPNNNLFTWFLTTEFKDAGSGTFARAQVGGWGIDGSGGFSLNVIDYGNFTPDPSYPCRCFR